MRAGVGSTDDDDDDDDEGEDDSDEALYARTRRDGGRKPLLPAAAPVPDPALLQYRNRKTEVLQKQDEILDDMHSSARQLYHVTRQINGQFDAHNKIIAELDTDVEVSCCVPPRAPVLA